MVNSLMDIHVVCTCVLSLFSTISLLSISDRFFPNSVGDQSEGIWLFFFFFYSELILSLSNIVWVWQSPTSTDALAKRWRDRNHPPKRWKKTIHLSHE